MTPDQTAEMIEVARSVSQCFYFLTGALCVWTVATVVSAFLIATRPRAKD